SICITTCLCYGVVAKLLFFFFQAEDRIRGFHVTGVQTCALPISVEALVDLHRPLRLAGAALLREDLDHTRGGFRTVQRRRSRALQYLDPLDVGGVDVVERRGSHIAAATCALRR